MRFDRVLSTGALLALAVTAQHAVASAQSTTPPTPSTASGTVPPNPINGKSHGTARKSHGGARKSDGTATLKIAGDPDAAPIGYRNHRATPGEGPVGGYEAYKSAVRTYPANVIPPAMVENAKDTFKNIAAQGDPNGKNHWQAYGPIQHSIEPGVLAFSGASDATAGRDTALVVAPTCVPGNCRLWVGSSGGGVWRTNDALASDPTWTWLTPDIAQNSVGTLVADPNDASGNTLYLGTGEGNRCSSGCEAGVGIYKTTDGGNTWTKLPDACVSNGTYSCVNSDDAFLGRGINSIVIDPTNPQHIFVGSALAVRGLSHVIGLAGETQRFEPGANPVGVYESTDGGNTFTEVWNGNGATFGVSEVGLDPLHADTVYASAFDNGVWRRSPTFDGPSTSRTDFRQVFAPQFPGGGTDRTMFALTAKNAMTRIYLLDGTANGGGTGSAIAGNFWRIDNADQSAAALLASQVAGSAVPPGAGNPFPAVYNGWQLLTAKVTASPYYPTDDTCTGQCWYDEEVYTPTGLPDSVYVIGSYNYGEIPCNTKGVGCGNGRSNGRAVLYSTTAGDPDASAPGTAVNRTFTDLTDDTQNTPATWCSLGADGEFAFGGVTPAFACLWAPNSIHPDQHAIVVNPSNPTQIFEGSDGAVIRTDGTFGDLSFRCNSHERPLLGAASLANCKRMLSRVPTRITHIDTNLDTLQFINVAINPSNPAEVQGGTQDNGTWSNNNPVGDRNTWPQVIYGDGGNAGYDGTNPTWRFNEFTGGFTDANFENGDPTKWVIISAPLVNSGETVGFYWPQVGDPNPTPGTHPIYSGLQHVWRSLAFGAGANPAAVPQNTTPDIANYEANCPEFTVSGGQPGCGDFQPMGGDLTGSTYGSDRAGGAVSWIARNIADHSTLWALTSAGRVFVTHNADASHPATVVWHRIDSSTSGASPTRFPSSVYPDPGNVNHAWVTYSGYNAATPTTPGHVFDVTEGGPAPGSGKFTNLNIERGTAAFPTPTNNGDLPANDIVRDDAKKKLYIATDFGVVRCNNDGRGDCRAAGNLPSLEVTHLEIEPSARVPTCVGTGKKGCPTQIYAATHSQGIWVLPLGGP
jgi:hypothetical protein